MNDFKHAYDALVASFEYEREIAERIENCFAESDVEGALALESELDAAQEQSNQLGKLYNKLVSVDTEDPAQLFVPASESEDAEEDGGPATIARAEFDYLSPVEKAEFVLAGGVIVEEAEE